MPMIYDNPLPMKGIVNFENHVRIASHFNGTTKTLYNVNGNLFPTLPREIRDDFISVLESMQQDNRGMYSDRFVIKVRNRNYSARCIVFTEGGWLIVTTTEPVILGRSTIPKTYYVAFSPEDLRNHKTEIYNMLGWDDILRDQNSEESITEEQNNSENNEQEEQTENLSLCNSCAFNSEGTCISRRIFRDYRCDTNYSGHMNINDEVATMLLQNGIPKTCTLCEMCIDGKLVTSCMNCIRNNFSNYSEKQISYVQNVWEYHKKFTKL
jgi:hypothetical protein